MKSLRTLRSAFTALALGAAVALRATGLDPTALGFDLGRLQRLDATIQDNIDRGQIAGAVMYVARNDRVIELHALGKQDIEAGKPMAPDTIFRIASMSKAVTAVAVMMLYEQGKFMLHDPVGKFIPGFTHSVVAEPPPPGSPAGMKFVTVPAKRPIQIRDLLTHTAGLTYGDGPAVDLYDKALLHGWYFANHDETIGEAIDRLATLPLQGQPGKEWQYGFSYDVLGRLVEVVSGEPLDRYFAEHIFGPLKMVDTCFYLPPEKESRLAKVYGLQDGKLIVGEQGDYVRGPRKCFSGGAGLLSTASDYGRLLRMLLNDGELDGVRLLSRKSVELMHANHTGDKFSSGTGAFGLGFWVMPDIGRYGELGSVGSYGWGSAYYPQYLVDPKEHLVAFMMAQLIPSGGLPLNEQVKVLTYQALVP